MTLIQFLIASLILLACILACVISYQMGYADARFTAFDEATKKEEERIDDMYKEWIMEQFRDRLKNFEGESDYEWQFDDGYLPQDPPEQWERSEEDE